MHVIFQQCAEGSVKVATSERMDYKTFREGYVATMKSAGAEFDKAGEFYTLSQDTWSNDVRKRLESFGLKVGEQEIPAAGSKVKTLNKWQRAALSTLPVKLRDLASLIEGGALSAEHLKVCGKIVELL